MYENYPKASDSFQSLLDQIEDTKDQ